MDDGVHAEALKGECRQKTQLWDDFNAMVRRCWEDGQIPKAWCVSSLVLIPKAGGTRGIALVPVMWKVLSRIILKDARLVSLLLSASR